MGCVIENRPEDKGCAGDGLQDYPEECGGLQVSGLTYTIDTSVKSSVRLDDKEFHKCGRTLQGKGYHGKWRTH